MKVYLAALLYNNFRVGSPFWGRLNEREKQAVFDVGYLLDSYHYVHKEVMVERIRISGRSIFLDSGAFSAYTQGVEIDIDEYIQYIKDHQDFVEVASVLDAIGDPDQTYRNQNYMEKRGVEALPCYHYGEDEEILKYYVANYDYITIGGMVPISSAQLKIWLDRIWGRHLVDEEGRAKVKVHGFGLTSIPLMARYPWYSVDSSSWVQLGGVGAVFFPTHGMIHVSEHSPNLKDENQHIDSLPEEQRKVLVDFVESNGFDMDRMRVSHLTRKCFNMLTYNMMMDLQEEDKRFVQKQPEFF